MSVLEVALASRTAVAPATLRPAYYGPKRPGWSLLRCEPPFRSSRDWRAAAGMRTDFRAETSSLNRRIRSGKSDATRASCTLAGTPPSMSKNPCKDRSIAPCMSLVCYCAGARVLGEQLKLTMTQGPRKQIMSDGDDERNLVQMDLWTRPGHLVTQSLKYCS